ncbi:DUF4139 domain-containing protein [Marinilabilia rubra]|uniref:Mucoidy inhibitor n=1 Tax=Marinilabilia rubra TaxID=2162893 RepID=A0A2U2BCW6_9BACT|nr:DUF4139 domain-containing protein [Marinilabilia rubra]PWE00908.1 mucoidy inhibitor [Marinilabilia rubra]
MRKIFLFIALLGLGTLHAQTSKEVTSEITDVTVYLNGAQITREAEVSIPSGRTELLFKGITSRLNSGSLQVGSEKEITILSVNQTFDYLEKAKVDENIASLRKKRDDLLESIEDKRSMIRVYSSEKEMLLKNQQIGGNENGVNIDELMKAASFFRSHLKELESLTKNLDREIKDLNLKLNDINQQLRELNSQKQQPTSTVKVAIKTDRAVNTKMFVNYTIRQASWEPMYDIRVNSTKEPLTLVYRAKVRQRSEEKWENVNLTLSTGNPSISNYKPELHKWYVYSKPLPPPPPPKVSGVLHIVEDDVELTEELVIEDTESDFSRKEKSPRKMATSSLGNENISIQQQQTTTSFKIDIPYSIPSDNQDYDVSIVDYEVPVDYQFAAIPKLSPHVYLMALATNWYDLNLLPGGANIYYQQTYQGKTYLDSKTSSDTLALSIGRDPGIIVEREMQKDRSEKSLFGSTRKETKAWVITVRNTKNTEVSVEIEDQYPLSRSGEIKVELEEAGKADVNETEGKLTWNLDLKPGEVKELKFVYSVRYPKDMDVIVE